MFPKTPRSWLIKGPYLEQIHFFHFNRQIYFCFTCLFFHERKAVPVQWRSDVKNAWIHYLRAYHRPT